MSRMAILTFVMIIVCGIVAQTQAQLTIDMNCDPRLSHRLDDCPSGYCCVRDEFLPTWVYCRKAGVLGEDCTTRDSESNCPCSQGLSCSPNIVSHSGTASLYGSCKNTTEAATTTTTESPTTITMEPTSTMTTTNTNTTMTTSNTTMTTSNTTMTTTNTTMTTTNTMTSTDTTTTGPSTPCPHGHSCEHHGHAHETDASVVG